MDGTGSGSCARMIFVISGVMTWLGSCEISFFQRDEDLGRGFVGCDILLKYVNQSSSYMSKSPICINVDI
jgi:hypothetical protein